jgi:AcrR family transcriptional regulator
MAESSRQRNKTRKAVFASFMRLLQSKPYAQITVQEIIDDADIGRTTFYSHFPTKDDLLIECIDELLPSLHHLVDGTDVEGDDRKSPLLVIPDNAVFEHIHENAGIIRSLILHGNGDLLFARIKGLWIERVIAYFEGIGYCDNQIPVSVLANHIVESFFALISWWVINDPSCEPGVICEYYKALITPLLPAAGS